MSIEQTTSVNETETPVPSYIHALEKRLAFVESTLKNTLELIVHKEQTVELTVTSMLARVFETITTGLTASLKTMNAQIKLNETPFTIEPVLDPKDINDQTVVITKTETGYDFSKPLTPDVITNTNTEIFHELLDANPDFFKEKNSILANIYVEAKK